MVPDLALRGEVGHHAVGPVAGAIGGPRLWERAAWRLLAACASGVDHGAMTVIALPKPGRWVWDARDRTRALRVSTHPEQGLLNLSVWRDDVCVGTVKLRPEEASGLVAALSEGLARLVPAPPPPVPPTAPRVADVVDLETRLAAVESRLPAPRPPVRVAARALAGQVRGRLADLIRG